MGKKRTSVTKKKQVAKKKKLTSAYGVSVSKGGTLARNNGVLDTNPIADGNSRTKKQNGASSKGEGSAKNIAPVQNNGKQSKSSVSTRDIPGKRSRNHQGENDEFQRMQDSLEERSLALQARKDEQRRGKKGGRKHQKKGWGKLARPLTTNHFTPAISTLVPKTTDEMVDDAANQVAQGMSEIGQRSTNPFNGPLLTTGQSSLAAAASLNWKMPVSNVVSQVQQPQYQNNSFAAFNGDSDSDNEWADKKTKAIKNFQFKPAAFSFQPPQPVTGDDFDPDL